MKVLVLFGGPRLNMNTDTLLKAYLEGIDEEKHEIERINIRDLKIAPCTACYGCSKNGECVLHDDMDDIYEKMESADAVIFASPIFFNSITAISKMLVDRCQIYWTKKFMLGARRGITDKLGVLLLTGGPIHKDRNVPGASLILDLFFKSIDAKFKETILIDNTDKVQAKDQLQALEDARIQASKLFD